MEGVGWSGANMIAVSYCAEEEDEEGEEEEAPRSKVETDQQTRTALPASVAQKQTSPSPRAQEGIVQG